MVQPAGSAPVGTPSAYNKAYAAAMGHGGVYTPQIIVDGVMDIVGSRGTNVELAVAQREAAIAQATAIAMANVQTQRALAAAAVGGLLTVPLVAIPANVVPVARPLV